MIYFENVDGRVCILFPYLGKVLLGSTDIRVERPGRVRCEDEEVAYILKSLSYVFPGIPVAPEQIVYRYSGVRPLPRSDASFTGRISRDHFVERIAGTPPTLCLVGGKWTTFRAFGAQAADQALAILGDAARPTAPRSRRIGGGVGFPTDAAGQEALTAGLAAEFGVPRERAAHAVSLYGTNAGRVLAFCRDGPDAPLADTGYSRNEIRYLVRHEHARTLADILQRRTALAITGALSSAAIAETAAILADELGWSPQKAADAERAFRTPARRRSRADRRHPRRTRPQQDTEPRMRMSPKARMNRLFTNGRCLDVAIDHGVCNEPSFMAGLEDIGGVVDQLIAAGPDAIQMNYGQADLLQSRPEKAKPALVMRIDMGNPYNDSRHRVMWAELQNRDEPIIGALEMDAACVVVNLFMLPDEPELFRQCVANIAATRAACARYGMPLMIEPLVMLPNDVRGGYQVDGDADKIVTLVRLAAEMGADIIKADPTDQRRGLPPRRRGRARAGAGARRRQGGSAGRAAQVGGAAGAGRLRPRLWPQHLPAREPEARGRRADGDDPPRRLGRRGMGDLPAMAEPGLLLGLDAGNTVIKAVLFDRDRPPAGGEPAQRRLAARRRPAMSSATWRSSGPTPPR